MASKKKLLLVDDEPDILQFLKKRLEKNNFEIVTVEDAQKCVDTAEKMLPDLILLDIVMPFIDGYELIKKLRDNPSTRDIPIVMHSVKKETESIFKCMELGSVDFVTKPVSLETLLKVIRRYI